MPFFKNQHIKYQGRRGKLLRREGEEWLVEFPGPVTDLENFPGEKQLLLEDHLQHWTDEDDRLVTQATLATTQHQEFLTTSLTWNTYLLKIEDARKIAPTSHPKSFTGRPGDPSPLQVQWDSIPLIHDLCFVLAITLTEAIALATTELHLDKYETLILVHEFPLESPIHTALLNLNQVYRDFDLATNRHWLHPQNLRVFVLDH